MFNFSDLLVSYKFSEEIEGGKETESSYKRNVL